MQRTENPPYLYQVPEMVIIYYVFDKFMRLVLCSVFIKKGLLIDNFVRNFYHEKSNRLTYT